MDRVRDVLRRIEESTEPYARFDGEDAHYVAIFLDAGLVDATLLETNMHGIVGSIVKRLTWQGHEFLDAVRSDTIWNHTKEKIGKSGGSWTVSLLLQVATLEIKKQLGLL